MNRSANRNILMILGFLILVVAASSCKKYLNQTPANSLTATNFFKTKADAQASITSCYDGLQACVNKFLNWGESRGDLVNTTTNNTTQTYPFYQYLDKTYLLSDWTEAYTLIGRTNIVIASVPNIVNQDAQFSKQESDAIVAEALFLRSLAYFYLVRTFKDVPLVLQAPTNDAVNYFLPKSPSDSVLNQIETDLATAEASIPTSYPKAIETVGRATKNAVNALQTDVYLWRAKYQQASDAATKVISDSLNHPLVPGDNWFNIFTLKNSTESIFELQFDYNINEINNLIGVSTSFTANSVLINYYTADEDKKRGLNRTYTSGNSFWKYNGVTTDGTNLTRSTSDPNFIFYRMPDIMLMKAEALAHLGSFEQKEEAAKWINRVRARVSLPIYDYLNGNAPYSLLIDLIFKERAMELAMEGKRWFDLVRVATNDQNPDFLISRILASRSVGDRALIRSRIIDPRSWYMPILQNELNKNPQLVQNPYYR